MSTQFDLDNMTRTFLDQTIVIDNLITLHYSERDRNYVFRGERHDFWELLYVDKGEIEVTADADVHLLSQGSIIFHKPNEFHRFHAIKGTAPNFIVITFDCHSEAMRNFYGRIIRLDSDERNLLAQFIAEAQHAFTFPFQYPLQRRKDAPAGSEQLVKNYLEIFLLRLLRRNMLPETVKGLSTLAQEKRLDDIARQMINYMYANIGKALTVADICDHFHISRTQIATIFKENTGHTIKEYFNKLKMEQAKQYIRENADSVTEISEKLGFSTIHAFSSTFKKWTGMSPSEYARSVKARID
ncbi:helix-turn-helix domain-containing protein [Paenibacillus sp. GCM10027626]|uniref:AraC family transcriptional regulator n=1 Tax=Paenibacillus sp. GCM10027626 TaxID=3273411 RepID=UPI00363962F5